MTTGSAAYILDRVKGLIPYRWFSFVAPYRDAIIGGVADSAAWNYTLIFYAKAQTRLATAYGVWLDLISQDFLGQTLPRQGLSDPAFQTLIKATVLQERVTRHGMMQVVQALTTNPPIIFEPWNNGDAGAYSNPYPGGQKYGQFGYGVGKGGWGSLQFPGQCFIQLRRSAFSGIPLVGGYGSPVGGYGMGSIEWTGSLLEEVGITDDIILKAITQAKPTGSTVWARFVDSVQIQATPEWIWLNWY